MDVGIVAYRFDYYPYVRNIIGIVPGANYRKVKDVFSRMNAAARLLNRLARRQVISTFDLNNQFNDFNLNRVDLLHLFNGISYGHTPWVSTFETVLPRFERVVQISRQYAPVDKSNRKVIEAFEMLAGPNCRQIIAISNNTAHMQRSLIGHYCDYPENVEKKIVVMHPPQDLLVSKFEDKRVDLGNSIKFMFVGNAFFRKGGFEILETLKILKDQYHYPIELTIVSALNVNGYAVPVAPETIKRAKAFIQENKDWIIHYPQLPNPEVLELMKKAHVGMLPTYADTYGYSVLEFQAAGCPVISTNVRALPEINDNEKGWLIDVPKNDLGEAIYTTESDRASMSDTIRAGLEKAVHEIFCDTSIIQKKCELSVANIKGNHSRADFTAKMMGIYIAALS